MEQSANLRFMTTANTLSDDLLVDMGLGELMAGMTFGHILEYAPVLENSPAIICVYWQGWSVFIRDKKFYTRKMSCLLATSKDGGAHIDNPDAN